MTKHPAQYETTIGAYGPDAVPDFLPPDAEPPCRGRADVFFPERGEAWRVAVAKAICRRCPFYRPCRTWALRQTWELYGIWGATTRMDRHRHHSRRRARQLARSSRLEVNA